MNNKDYPFLLSCGTLVMANDLARCENNDDRKEKKQRVVERKRALVAKAFPGQTAGDVPHYPEAPLRNTTWRHDTAVTFLIDLAFTNPFAPYELKITNRDFEKALVGVATEINIGDPEKTVGEIIQTQKAALYAHRQVNWTKAAIWGAGGTVMCALGSWMIAPLIGTAIGGATGLAGAAATSHGLAILGGGSLALGGSGMAGGMWIVTGVGASLGSAAGLVGVGGTEFLIKLGAAQAKAELLKLQVHYKVIALGLQTQLAQAQMVTTKLAEHVGELKKQCDEERQLNESNSSRVKVLEATLQAAEKALDWIKQQSGDGEGARWNSKG